jgi:hypothetical protein
MGSRDRIRVRPHDAVYGEVWIIPCRRTCRLRDEVGSGGVLRYRSGYIALFCGAAPPVWLPMFETIAERRCTAPLPQRVASLLRVKRHHFDVQYLKPYEVSVVVTIVILHHWKLL